MPKNSKPIQEEIDKKTGGKGKKKPGKAFVPTEEHHRSAKLSAEQGLSQDQARRYILDENELPISLDTFRKYFENDWETGLADSQKAIHRNMFVIATTNKGMPGVVAATNLLQTRHRKHGYSKDDEVQKIEVSGKDGDAIKHEHSVDVSSEVGGILAKLAGVQAKGSEEDSPVEGDSQG
jgi:hypothetical protein